MATDHIGDTYDAGKLWGEMLLKRLATGKVDEVQKALWDRWLAENPHMREGLDELDDAARLKVLIERYQRIHASGAEAYQAFLSLVSDPPARRRPFRRLYYYLSGAAAAILLTFSITLFVHRSRPATPAPTASLQDLAPGSSKAVLSLAGGQTILLDSAPHGLIQQQGGARIMNQAGGLLAYKEDIGNHNPQLYNTITTGRGGQYRLELSDGTLVWLDAASSLHYPTAFSGATREVTLTGQGYFEVAHGRKPFIVHTGKTDIQDLGTAFNVNAYPESDGVVTTLLSGAVRIGSATLRPGQQAWATPSGTTHISGNVDTDEVVAWKEGRFQFTAVPFSVVLQYLSRWYDVDVVDKTDIHTPVVLSVPRNVPISVLMKAFTQTNRIRYRIEGKTMIVEPNQ